ncbi:hypothetical protein MAR_021410 [Mya arenaria]|uniref:IstB-like ATP-binding protein domain-containing protein n=1 Tax=Mya arenaria TaxID=6604 RepID=A0ABY7EFV3_MYAAR|nr:hypothetical protein MAR_021410 [Mya arenaria]
MFSHSQMQRKMFDFTMVWSIDLKNGMSPLPFYIFLSGGAGVGKSHLIHAIYQGVSRVLRLPGQNPVKDRQKNDIQCRKPGAEKLNTLRSTYANLRLIIADEISIILAVGDLLQLNPVGDKPIFKPISHGYEALAGSLWTQ